MGADIYLYDQRRRDLDARIDAWVNEPTEWREPFVARVEPEPEREHRSMVHIWQGGIDETSRALAKEHQALQETHYFRDSYNASSLFWRLGLSWWGLLNGGFINDEGILNADTVRMLLDGYNELSERMLSEEATLAWYAEEEKKGTLFSDDEGPNFWVKYFQEKGQRFAEFCQRTLENDGHWECSV